MERMRRYSARKRISGVENNVCERERERGGGGGRNSRGRTCHAYSALFTQQTVLTECKDS